MAKQQKVTIELPSWVNPDDVDEIGEAIVQFIRDRTDTGVGVTARGKGWAAKDFPDYTQEYADRKGVNVSNVDLQLSDEMLDALGVLKTGKRAVTIGYEAGDDLNGRVEGNRIGSYGRAPNPRKARDFLGITKADLELILDPYRPEE